MSRSNPQEDVVLNNPCTRYLEWSGAKGEFKYYDKENKKQVEVPLPLSFLPLAKCTTLKGWNQKEEKGYWANEVKDTSKDKFIVMSKEGVEKTGLYSEKSFRDWLELKDVKFVESVYVGIKNDKGKLELCNLQIKGAALKPWFELTKVHKYSEIAVVVKSTTDEKNGGVKYKAPVFEPIVKVSKEMNDQAIALDVILQDYLKPYFERNSASTVTESTDATESKAKTTETKTESKSSKTTDKAPFKEEPHPLASQTDDIHFGDDGPPEF